LEGDSSEKVKINNRIKAFEKALVEIIRWKIQWINNNKVSLENIYIN
jgi:hypothetical protein